MYLESTSARYKRPSRSPSCTRLFISVILTWSIICLVLGLALTAGGVFLFVSGDVDILYPYLSLLQELVFDVRILVVVFGGVVTVCSVLCLVGVCTKKKHLLQVYCYLVILLLLVQFGTALFIYINKQSLIDIMHNECVRLMSHTDYVTLLNDVQTRLECCGCYEPADYIKLGRNSLPDSCYGGLTAGEGEPFEAGCLTTVFKAVEDNTIYQIVAGSIIAVLLLLIIISINCYVVRYDSDHVTDHLTSKRNRVTPSPSPSVTHLNNWVSTGRGGSPAVSTTTRLGGSPAVSTNTRLGGSTVVLIREDSF